MKFIGKIVSVNHAFDGKFTVTLEGPDAGFKELAELSQLENLSVEIKRCRIKRSLDANAYYWCLVGKIAAVTGDSSNRIHNILLDRCGILDTLEDDRTIMWCIRDDIDYLELTCLHLKPTQKTQLKNGIRYRWYYQLKGSSEYDTGEMSRLINLVVEECKGINIETLPPEELDRMMTLYEQTKKCMVETPDLFKSKETINLTAQEVNYGIIKFAGHCRRSLTT